MNPTPTANFSCSPLPGPRLTPFAATAPTTTGQFARQVIRQLLDGAAADTFAAIPLAELRPLGRDRAAAARGLCRRQGQRHGRAGRRAAGHAGRDHRLPLTRAGGRPAAPADGGRRGCPAQVLQDARAAHRQLPAAQVRDPRSHPRRPHDSRRPPQGRQVVAGAPDRPGRLSRRHGARPGRAASSRCSFWGSKIPSTVLPTGSRSCWRACTAGGFPSSRNAARSTS